MITGMIQSDVCIDVYSSLQKQEGGADCGVFAIAIAISLCHDIIPSTFNQSQLRLHLLSCFEDYLIARADGYSRYRP